jgi:hypothetical protein
MANKTKTMLNDIHCKAFLSLMIHRISLSLQYPFYYFKSVEIYSSGNPFERRRHESATTQSPKGVYFVNRRRPETV